jgi:hypothetical protein
MSGLVCCVTVAATLALSLLQCVLSIDCVHYAVLRFYHCVCNNHTGDDFAKDTRKYNKEFAATHEPLEKYVPPDYSEFDDEDEDNNDLLSSEARAADKANAAAAAAKALKEKAAKLKKLFERSPDSGDDDNLPQ